MSRQRVSRRFGRHVALVGLPLIVLASAAGGCLDRRAGSAVDVADGAAAPDADTGSPTSPDVAITDTEAADGCVPVLEVSRQGVIHTEQGYELGPPFLDGTRIYTMDRVYRDGGSVDRLLAFELAEEAEPRVIVESEAAQVLLDADSGLLLHATLSSDYTARGLHLRDGEGRVLATLLDAASGDEGVRLVPSAFEWSAATHMIDGADGGAAWAEQHGMSGGPGRVRAYRDGVVHLIFEGEGYVGAPYLRDGRVLFASGGEERALWLAQVGEEPRRIADEAPQSYALSDDAAWWIMEGRVMRYDFANARTSTVRERGCAGLVADAGRVAAVCGDAIEGGWYPAWPGTPVVFEGERATELAVAGGNAIAALVLTGRQVAWVEYPEGVGCDYDIASTGTLLIADVARPGAPSEVATVGSGCWCCDAYWPPMVVHASGRALAWNYPIGPEANLDPWARRGAVGWALLGGTGCR